MVKLLISDVDGTLLLPGQSRVSETLMRSLSALISSGKQVAIASGRTYYSLKMLFGEISESAYFIPCDGALCIKNGRILYQRPISAENIRRALSVARENGLALHLAAADHGYAFGGEELEARLTEEHADDITPITALSEIRAPIYKLAFYGKKPNFTTVPADLRRSYHGNGWCEYVYRFTDKGTALSDLQSRLYLAKYDTAAIGDGANDLTMLKGAKYAYALSERLAAEVGASLYPSAEQALRAVLAAE
ncbi:MAG: HAD-IIB family hydrolase [Clostridia bacterium]|nr:HAD-IIB family hydrolase [Clostridia bacterium]